MAVTNWEAPVTANLRVPIQVDEDAYIITASGTGTAVKAVNKNLNGYWEVPTNGDATTGWARSLHNLLYLFGIESGMYNEETDTEYTDVQATVTFKNQTLSTEGGN